METPAQFYVTLPSSSDEILFPSNAVTHFKTVLNPIIDFMNDKYEVALAEFHLRGSVYNFETPFRMLKVVTPSTRENFEHFSKHKNKVTYGEKKDAVRVNLVDTDNVSIFLQRLNEDEYRCTRHIFLKPGSYNSFKDIIIQLSNTLFRHLSMTLGISETKKNRVKDRTLNLYLTSGAKELYPRYTISACPYFVANYCIEAKEFSFDNSYVIFDENKSSHTIRFDTEISLPKALNHEIIVYSDICDFSYFGSTKLPILRACKIPISRWNKYNHVIIYDTPHYVPVISDRIQEIEIQLRDLSGHLFPIVEGHAIVKLHFRRIENN